MKKGFALFLAALTACLWAFPALAAGKATITEEVSYVLPYYDDTFAGHVYGVITNTGDSNVEVDSGTYEFYNAEGDAIASDSLYSFYPEILAPGEKSVFWIRENVEEATEPTHINSYDVTIVGKSTDEAPTTLSAVGSFEETLDYSDDRQIEMIAEVRNDTAETVWDPYVVFALYDTEDKLLYVDYDSQYDMGLFPGSTIVMACEVSGEVQDYLNANNVTVGRVEVSAWYEGR